MREIENACTGGREKSYSKAPTRGKEKKSLIWLLHPRLEIKRHIHYNSRKQNAQMCRVYVRLLPAASFFAFLGVNGLTAAAKEDENYWKALQPFSPLLLLCCSFHFVALKKSILGRGLNTAQGRRKEERRKVKANSVVVSSLFQSHTAPTLSAPD